MLKKILNYGKNLNVHLAVPPPDEISSYALACYIIFVYLIEIRFILNLPIFLVKFFFSVNDCLTDRQEALDDPSTSSHKYIPECTTDGRYKHVQCYKSVGKYNYKVQ